MTSLWETGYTDEYLTVARLYVYISRWENLRSLTLVNMYCFWWKNAC